MIKVEVNGIHVFDGNEKTLLNEFEEVCVGLLTAKRIRLQDLLCGVDSAYEKAVIEVAKRIVDENLPVFLADLIDELKFAEEEVEEECVEEEENQALHEVDEPEPKKRGNQNWKKKPVIAIRLADGSRMEYGSVREASKGTGVSTGTISLIANGHMTGDRKGYNFYFMK